MVITMIYENLNGPATPADAVQWAEDYGLTFPVVADPGNTGLNYMRADPGFDGTMYFPNVQLLSPGMKIEVVNSGGGISESAFLPFLDEE